MRRLKTRATPERRRFSPARRGVPVPRHAHGASRRTLVLPTFDRQKTCATMEIMPIKIGQRPDHGFDEPLGLLSDCHRRIENFLDVLARTAQQVAGGPLNDRRRADLEGALAYFQTAAPRHTADEEASLFPRLRASGDPAAAAALETVTRLERDHGAADQHHAEVDRLVRRWLGANALPADDLAALNEHLAALRAIYEPHIAIEDRELFPTAARLLSPSQIEEIGREMAARRGRTRN
jgi:hemerythrin-like domain-containing protein